MGKKGQKGVHLPPPQKRHRTYKHQAGNKKKRRHRRLYWIQDCPDFVPPSFDENDDTANDCVTVKLTEIHLSDDLHGATATVATFPSSNGDNPSTRNNDKSKKELEHKDDVNDTKKSPALLSKESTDTLQHEVVPPLRQDNIKAASSVQTQHNEEIVVNEPQTASTDTDDVVDYIFVPRKQKVYVKRIQSEKNSFLENVQLSNYIELPNGNNGDGICNPYNPKLVPNKYWAQRKRLFHRYDNGIQMGITDQDIGEAFFSITPECIAHHIAKRMIQHHYAISSPNQGIDTTEPYMMVDAFVGVGGNAIALALHDPYVVVVCIDIDINKLYCTANNASNVYHIPQHQMILLHHDACTVLSQYYKNGKKQKSSDAITSNSSATAWNTTTIDKKKLCGYTLVTSYDELPSNIHGIFLSPPWGGVNYEDIGPRHYNLQENIKLVSTSPFLRAALHPPATSPTEPDSVGVGPSSTSAQSMDTIINGEVLLGCAMEALPIDRLNIAYYLPRNLNGVMFGLSCYNILFRGRCGRYDDDTQEQQQKHHRRIHHIELEQNIVNTKLKTVTAYIQSSE